MASAVDSLAVPSVLSELCCAFIYLHIHLPLYTHWVNGVPYYCCAFCFEISPSELPYHPTGIATDVGRKTVEQSSLFTVSTQEWSGNSSGYYLICGYK